MSIKSRGARTRATAKTKSDDKLPVFLSWLWRYCVFFLTICAIITCCMVLFLHTAGVNLTRENVTPAAKITFVNILVLSLIATIIDIARRHLTVKTPVKRIAEAAEKVMQGDLSIRIPRSVTLFTDDSYNDIIGYFNRMTEELSGMETLRADFIANVSHELKTPLAVIQNYGTMLQQPELDEQTRVEYAKAITSASRGLADMVANILKLNKLENQSIYPDARVFNLGEQLSECFLGFEDIWEKKNLEIDTDIDDDVYVDADPELLSLVWNNLFSNAMKFTEPGGQISLSLKTKDGKAVVRVRDTGCGISPEVGRHIFEKFYQGDTSHTTKGNGLGLALVKRVIDITGGDISVDSRVGEGSTFSVAIKVASQ